MKIQQLYPIQHDSKVALVFDVETSGLLGHKQSLYSNLDEIPYVVQLSYALYDLTHGRLLKTVDTYIRIPIHVQMSAEASKVNGIDQELCQREGYPMLNVLRNFYDDYHLSSVIVAHNYNFDSRMMSFEFQRHWDELKFSHPYALNLFHPAYMKHNGMKSVCTMIESIQICCIPYPQPKSNNNNKVQIDLPMAPSTTEVVVQPIVSSLNTPTRRSTRNQPLALSSVVENSSDSSSNGNQTVAESNSTTIKFEKKVSYKWPKLAELYNHYFGAPPSGLHDAMTDVLVALRCYLKLTHDETVNHEQFSQWFAIVRK